MSKTSNVLRAAGRLAHAARRLVGGRDLMTGARFGTPSLEHAWEVAKELRDAVDEYDDLAMKLCDGEPEEVASSTDCKVRVSPSLYKKLKEGATSSEWADLFWRLDVSGEDPEKAISPDLRRKLIRSGEAY